MFHLDAAQQSLLGEFKSSYTWCDSVRKSSSAAWHSSLDIATTLPILQKPCFHTFLCVYGWLLSLRADRQSVTQDRRLHAVSVSDIAFCCA